MTTDTTYTLTLTPADADAVVEAINAYCTRALIRAQESEDEGRHQLVIDGCWTRHEELHALTLRVEAMLRPPKPTLEEVRYRIGREWASMANWA